MLAFFDVTTWFVLGGRVLLSWTEPRPTFSSPEPAPLHRRLWRTYGEAVASGVVFGLAMTVVVLLGLALQRGALEWAMLDAFLILAPPICLAMTVVFVLGRSSARHGRWRVHLKERCVILASHNHTDRWDYDEFEAYTFEDEAIGGEVARMLVLIRPDATEEVVFIAPEVSDREIDRALWQRLPKRAG